MYELIPAAGHAYYLNCPSKIGLVELGGGAVAAIDSGNDKDAGKKLLRVVKEQGWTLTAVYHTHSHADHIGGTRYVQEQTGCAVYAPGIECDFTNHPILEPAMLWGGFPPKDLRHKFLMAQESRALPLTEAVLPEGLTMLPLPGHCFDMVGFRTAEDVVYLADCLSARETLEKYGIGYVWDVEACLQTLERVAVMEARCFVPAHAPVTEDVGPLARYNMDAILAVGEKLCALCTEPVQFERLLQLVFETYGLTMTFQQYGLMGSTLRSYLTWLQNRGQVTCEIENNRLLWRKA